MFSWAGRTSVEGLVLVQAAMTSARDTTSGMTIHRIWRQAPRRNERDYFRVRLLPLRVADRNRF